MEELVKFGSALNLLSFHSSLVPVLIIASWKSDRTAFLSQMESFLTFQAIQCEHFTLINFLFRHEIFYVLHWPSLRVLTLCSLWWSDSSMSNSWSRLSYPVGQERCQLLLATACWGGPLNTLYTRQMSSQGALSQRDHGDWAGQW
jgi:hypothetical protein